MKYLRTEAGITMVEILVVLVVGAIAGVILVSTIIQSNDIFYSQTGKVNEGLGLNDAAGIIKSDIKTAASVASSYPAASPYQYQSSVSTLVLKVPSIDSSGNILESVYDFIVFYKDPNDQNVLLKKVIPVSPSQRGSQKKVLAKNLKNVSFYYKDSSGNFVSPIQASKINFVLVTQTKTGLETTESSSSGEVNLRND